MTNKEESQLVVTDLPIALYLNQQVTFDILAALEDGFSRFSTVETTSSGEKSTEVFWGSTGWSQPHFIWNEFRWAWVSTNGAGRIVRALRKKLSIHRHHCSLACEEICVSVAW